MSAGAAPSRRADVSVVVVNWNTKDLLRACLASLAAQRTSVDLEVIVVDNGSNDGSAELVRNEHTSARLIANLENRGYSTANNQGVRAATGRYVLLLNSDTTVHPGSLRVLVDFGDSHERAGILGPRLLNGDGTLQPSGGRFPTPLSTIIGLMGVYRITGRPRYGTRRDYSKPAVVDEVSGAAMVIRREVIEQIGLLDEEFAWGYEDVDFCKRAHEAGWEVQYVPAAVVVHEWGASRRLAPSATVLRALQGRRHYFRKHHGRMAAGLVMGATALSHLVRAATFAVGGVANRALRARASTEWQIFRGLVTDPA